MLACRALEITPPLPAPIGRPNSGITDARIESDRPSRAASSETSWQEELVEGQSRTSRIDRDEPAPMDGGGSNPDEEIPIMSIELLCKKLGMTQVFTETGAAVPVTVLEAGPNTVIQKKTAEKDGYDAV